MLSKWKDEREAMVVAQLVGYTQGVVLIEYLIRSREELLKILLAARGEDLVRTQGQVQMLDETLERLLGADNKARIMEQKRKARGGNV